MKRVLFVCTANVCRSPMAEAIFDALTEDMDLPFRAQSAGTSALRGEQMAPKARAALAEIGVYAGGHRARQVDGKILEEVDLVLAMEPRHVAELRRLFGSLSPKKLHTLAQYANGPTGPKEISDPYGHAMTAYRASVRQLLECLDLLVKRLLAERWA